MKFAKSRHVCSVADVLRKCLNTDLVMALRGVAGGNSMWKHIQGKGGLGVLPRFFLASRRENDVEARASGRTARYAPDLCTYEAISMKLCRIIIHPATKLCRVILDSPYMSVHLSRLLTSFPHLWFRMDYFHILHNPSLTWETMSRIMCFNLNLYPQGHLALTLSPKLLKYSTFRVGSMLSAVLEGFFSY